jgi:hypothetical protein
MQTYVRVLSFRTRTGDLDESGDSRRINQTIDWIGTKGGRVTNVSFRLAVGANFGVLVYLIQYEAPQAVDF